MNEICCRFGPEQQLVGVITEPSPTRGKSSTLVLISAGVTPKVGPFRLYAELARRLAVSGIRTLRFDLGGIGDSGQEFGQHPLAERTRLQIRAALDHLSERHELGELALGGLCSGAEDAFRYAEHDDRVKRVVLIDPFAYRTAGFGWRHLVYRAERRLARAVGLLEPLSRSDRRALVSYEYLPAAESSRILRSLLKRRAQLHFVYTGGMRSRFNHSGQLQAMFPDVDFAGLVALDHLPRLDHTQASASARRQLIDAIAKRLAD
jgi:pimeloyl-ACP methyl ester carboxylesterase